MNTYGVHRDLQRLT